VVKCKGVSFFPQSVPNWSGDGRTLRRAFFASQWIGDNAALEWIADMIRRWPYKEKDHRFVERFVAGTNAETSRGAFSNSMNMLLEGGLDAWLVGRALNDQALMDRGRDVIENVILPGQREDGLWNYSAASEGCDPYRLGTEECNYSQYVAEMLAYLLEYPEWRDRLLPVLVKSFDELCRRFELSGGAIYVKVHWGWGWTQETTLMNANLAWKLFHHAGQKQYECVIARRLAWLKAVDMGPKYQQVLRHLYDMHNLWEMMAEGVNVEGDLPELHELLPPLERMEREISVIPGGSHREMYFERKLGNCARAIQRKIHAIRTEMAGGEPPELIAGRGTPGAELDLPWRFGNGILSTRVRAWWTPPALSLRAVVANPDHSQPYHGSQTDMGDSVSLVLHPEGGAEIRLTAALTRFGPQVFRYADGAEFSQQRGWARDYHEGDILADSNLEVFIHSGLVEYDMTIPWAPLGIAARPGLTTPLTMMINHYSQGYFQYMNWGKDVRDGWTDKHETLRLE